MRALSLHEQRLGAVCAALKSVNAARVLDLGCGEGRLTWRYAVKPAMAIGIDPDRDALRVATIDRPSDLEHRVHFSNALAEWLPFPKETFDFVVLAWSF